MGELLTNLGYGVIGGLILNIMPCVLPVLTMKVYHVVQHARQDVAGGNRARQIHGIAYAGGVLASFALLAIAVIALKAAGSSLAWGMQFQHPPFVAGMAAVIFAFGLNALGVFEWSVSLSGTPQHQGYFGSFVGGILSAVMSTPCSAPFLGTAASFMLAGETPWWQTFSIFMAIGIGLASPFLLISFVPKLSALLPKPGAWMETFKQLMGFTLIATTVWLLGALQAQLTPDSINGFLWFLLVLSMALWGVHHFGGIQFGSVRRYVVRAVALAIVIGAGSGLLQFEKLARKSDEVATVGCKPTQVVCKDKIVWAAFSSKRVADETKGGRPVFIDYTAEWCANCKANERLFLETQGVRQALEATGVLPMKADFTNEDEEIQAWLDKLGRKAVPAYVIYLPDGTFDLMPEAITTQLVVDRLQAAAKRFPPKTVASGG
ncbi:MAG: hypothetical protein EXR77_15020 [Myxococcales bacterium]|nr:hypothetical protein [Myxococcales bacterium]